ncbi:MAG: hypothetical protein JWO05_557 [Gemmatimonadetes bacterium]|nr:hypothetical protein [Gemmatimonadota bacterium]
MLALIALVAGQRFGRSPAAAGAATTAEAPTDASGAPMGVAGSRAPDISQLTPEQRAERLYDRMMSMAERGQKDSVQFFAPMAMQAYEMLDSLNLDQRYDLGRLGEIAGNPSLARAQADTILSRDPNHLLGHILAANAARMTGDRTAESTHLRQLVTAEPKERARALPEYLLHQADIKAALAQASAKKP